MSDAHRGDPDPSTILVVEDDREIQYLLETVLGGGGRTVLTAHTGEEARQLLQENPPDLVILDLILPDLDGRRLLAEIRRNTSIADVPVVCISSRHSMEVRSECFALGADHFQEKPFDPEEVLRDVTVRLQRVRAKERQERHDDVTGLLNRAGFHHEADEALEGGDGHALLVLELDGFQTLHDKFGWGTAERITYEVARGLESAAPEGSVLGRLAGAEIAVLLPHVEGAHAPEEGERLLDAIRELPVEDPTGETFRLTASAGLAELTEGKTLDEALEEAVARVFAAREAGGNRLVDADSALEGPEEHIRILVAEDDDITAKILSHRLGREGFEVQRFDNGQAAYEAALELNPAIVILDVKMPGMDGFEVLERLRKTPAYARVPIIMLTSMGSEADVVRGFDLGADDYMLKPFSPSELLARVRRLMSRGRTSPEA